MKVRMAACAAGPTGVLRSGEVYELPDEFASRLIAAQAAIAVSVEGSSLPVVEQAVVAGLREEAVMPRKRRKRGGTRL